MSTFSFREQQALDLGQTRRPWPGRTYAGPFSLGHAHLAPENADEVVVPFELHLSTDVRLDLLDAGGRKVFSIRRHKMAAGPQSIRLNLSGLNLKPTACQLRLQTSGPEGVHRQQQAIGA